MFNYSLFNIGKMVFFLVFFILPVSNAYAYVVDIVSQGTDSYIIRGHLDKSDLVLETNANPWSGVFIWYNTPYWTTTATYSNESQNCSDNIDEALKTINKELSYAVMKQQNFSNRKDSTIFITCKISRTSRWKFDSYVGKPMAPNSPLCEVTAPSDINFGTVTEGDNNKVIEKQVRIKCDKATKMKLTLQGDDNKNVLVMSGTNVKLGVDGDTQSKGYDIKENEITTANLIFTLSDTGTTPGVKKGYVLLLSEVD